MIFFFKLAENENNVIYHDKIMQTANRTYVKT